jgi:hypothetical protein
MSAQCFYKLGVITYFYLQRDYIAATLCVNKDKPMTMCKGQCYLKKHLALTDDDKSQESTPPNAKQQLDFPVFLISGYVSPTVQPAANAVKNFHYTFPRSTKHSSIPFHPPAFA